MAGPLDTDDPWSRQPPPTPRGLARLRLLGGFELRASDGRIATPRSAKGRAIMAYLALSPRGVGERGRLAGLVWGEGADAKASLRQCLRELRHTLSEAGLQTLLVTDPQHVALDLRQVWVDAIEMRKLARAGGHIDLDAIAALYTGHLFEGVEVRDPGSRSGLPGSAKRCGSRSAVPSRRSWSGPRARGQASAPPGPHGHYLSWTRPMKRRIAP